VHNHRQLSPGRFAPKREQSYNHETSRDTGELLKEALTLSTEARAALADSLLRSLDKEVDADAEAAWQIEIQRRVAELDSQTVSPLTWAEVRSRLMATLPHEQ
jgi:putative addiction module component (TIGR02574 family)